MGGLLKMLMLDYGGGGGVSGYNDKLIKKLNSVLFFLSFHFILVLFCLDYTNNSQKKEFFSSLCFVLRYMYSQ